jgi:hypothetical protein
MTVCTVLHAVTPTRFYPTIKGACQYKAHFKKQADRGNIYIALILHEQKLVHISYITLVKCIIMPSENIETQRSIPLAL